MAAMRLSSPGLRPFLARAKKVSPPPSSAGLRPADGCVVDRLRPEDRHRGRDGRGLEQQRRSDMASIGTFKKSGDEFQGEIVTLSVQARGVRFVPETNRASENAPSHRVYVGRADYAELNIMRGSGSRAQVFRAF